MTEEEYCKKMIANIQRQAQIELQPWIDRLCRIKERNPMKPIFMAGIKIHCDTVQQVTGMVNHRGEPINVGRPNIINSQLNEQEARVPKVLNKRDGMPEGAVYVGRPSKWGNPYQIGRDGDRGEVIRKFTEYFLNSDMIHHVMELRGKDLVCWCAPEACHADILLILANT